MKKNVYLNTSCLKVVTYYVILVVVVVVRCYSVVLILHFIENFIFFSLYFIYCDKKEKENKSR